MKRPFFSLLAGVAALIPTAVFSEQVHNLHEAEVPVVSQGEEARHAGFVDAFETVLVKLSGRGETPRQPALADAVNAPERYVEQFRFVSHGATEPLTLWVRFDGRAVEQLLRDKGLPIWGSNRPALVTWLAVDEKGRRALVGTTDAGPVAVALRTAAQRRAIPAHLPAADAEDLGRLPPEEIFAGAADPVPLASSRYHAQATLTGALSRESDTQWRAHWTLYRDGAVLRQWDALGPVEAVAASGIGVSTDELARSFAAPVAVAGEGALAVQVNGVTTLDEFMRVSNYLRGLSGVTSVQPAEVTADQVVLRVDYQGSAQGLAQAVAAGETLAAVTEPVPAAELSYRLLK
jgi:hypothetical protein